MGCHVILSAQAAIAAITSAVRRWPNEMWMFLSVVLAMYGDVLVDEHDVRPSC